MTIWQLRQLRNFDCMKSLDYVFGVCSHGILCSLVKLGGLKVPLQPKLCEL